MRYLLVIALLAIGLFSLPSAEAGGRRNISYQSYCQPTYSYSYATPTYYTPTYVAPAYVAPAYVAPAVPTYSPDWKTAAIKYAGYLDDIAAFERTMNVLRPNFAASHSEYAAGYPAQGNSVFGYSVKTAQEAYSPVDINVMDQRSARLIDGVRDAFSAAHNERSQIVANLTDAQARVAEIQAKGQAAAIVQQQAALLMQSASAVPSTRTTTTVSGTTVAPNQQQPADQFHSNVASDPDMANFVRNVAIPSCGACHNAKDKKGGMDISQYASFTSAQRASIRSRLKTTDLTKRMPRDSAGKPLELSDEAFLAFMTH